MHVIFKSVFVIFIFLHKNINIKCIKLYLKFIQMIAFFLHLLMLKYAI
jgi:hypothetical protein